MTNGDRIRQMSNEELANGIITECSLCKYYYIGEFDCVVNKADCKEGIKTYLESEEE